MNLNLGRRVGEKNELKSIALLGLETNRRFSAMNSDEFRKNSYARFITYGEAGTKENMVKRERMEGGLHATFVTNVASSSVFLGSVVRYLRQQ